MITATTRWHEPPRLRHQVARQLARFYNVLFVELPFARAGSGREYELVEQGILVFRPKRLPRGFGRIWDNISSVHRLYNTYLAKKIQSRIRQLGCQNAVLINFQFNFPQIMKLGIFERKLYICNDEFPELALTAWKKRLLQRYEREVAAAADVCLAVSYPLLRKLEKIASSAHLLLPAHEFVIDECEPRVSASVHEDMPIKVCFMGYINSRLRFDWLLALLNDEEIRLTLIGPVQDRHNVEELARFKNLQVLSPMEGTELQKELSRHDVLIMPYDTRQLAGQVTSAPNKLFQYLACGKPIVISDMRNFIELPEGFLYRAADAEGFVRAVRRAFEEDNDEARRARLTYAAANSWNARGDQLLQILRSEGARRWTRGSTGLG